jgi:hypothetical protein
MLWPIPVDTHSRGSIHAPGQPTLYKPAYCELAHNYCLLGARAKKIRTDRLLLQFEKALLPVTVILDPCNGTQKFALLRAEPTGRERCGENMRHGGE